MLVVGLTNPRDDTPYWEGTEKTRGGGPISNEGGLVGHVQWRANRGSIQNIEVILHQVEVVGFLGLPAKLRNSHRVTSQKHHKIRLEQRSR